MSELSVTARAFCADNPDVAFAKLVSGELLHFECDRFDVGGAVSVQLPLADAAPGVGWSAGSIALLGHIAAIRPGRSLVITHHQPWRGRLVVRLFPDSSGTRIVLEDSLGADGLSWLADRRGFNHVLPPREDRHRIGLLVSKSGSAAVFAQATETLAALAIDEINADGGIRGVTAELIIGDDASDAATGAQTALRLVRSGCRAIFACATSATFNAAAAALRDSGVPIVHSVLNEGGPHLRSAIRLGERPMDQVRLAVPALMKTHGARSWFFVGNRYSWSYGAHWAARRVVAEHGGTVAGDAYADLGTGDFHPVIDQIERSGAELILSSLVGHDEVLFERQCARAGLRARTRTLALVLDEATLQLVGAADAEGIWAAFGYFQGMGRAVRGLEERYAAYAEGLSPPISSLSTTTYDAIVAYARSATTAADDLASIRRDLLAPVSVDAGGSHRPTIHLAEVRGGRFRVI